MDSYKMHCTHKWINSASTFLIFLFFFVSNFESRQAISANVSRLVKDLCQGGEVYGNQTFVSFPENSCCRSCEIGQICIERGTCCDDRWRHIKDFTTQVCLPGRKSRNMKRSANRLNLNYLVRAHCPSSFPYNDIKNKCENEEPVSLEDIPFASSRHDDIVYKNKHCAVCHGETNPIVWNLIVDHKCISNVFSLKAYSHPFQNASMVNNKIISSCSLYFERPDIKGINWKRLICPLDFTYVSDCPEVTTTGMASGSIKAELNDLCLYDKSISVAGSFHIYYSNVYCYLCNNVIGRKCFYKTPDKVLPSISIVLDLSLLKTTVSPTQQKQCLDDHFYDEYFEKCRQINCQIFEVAAAGKCVSFVITSKLNYAFNFELVPVKPLKTSSFRYVSKALLESLRSTFGFGRCAVCSKAMYLNRSEIVNNDREYVKFYANVVFTTSPTCQWKYIFSIADRLRHSQNLFLKLWNVTYMTKYFSVNEDFATLTQILPKIYEDTRCPSYYPYGFTCPWTTLSSVEMAELRNHTGNVATLETRENKNGDFELCIKTYENFIDGFKSCSTHVRHFTYAVVSFVVMLPFIMLNDM